jgi:hypothetical protein
MAIAEERLPYADIDRRADQRVRRKLREELNMHLTKSTRRWKLRRAIEPNQYRSPGRKAAALLLELHSRNRKIKKILSEAVGRNRQM